MPEAKQQFPDDYIRRSAEDNLNSRIISPQSPAKSDISNGHVTNVLPFVDLQGPRTAAWPTDNIMNTEVSYIHPIFLFYTSFNRVNRLQQLHCFGIF